MLNHNFVFLFMIPLSFHKWFSSLHFIEERLPLLNNLSLVVERKTDSVLKEVLSNVIIFDTVSATKGKRLL